MARSLTTRSTNPKIMDDNIKILDDALAIASAPPAEDVSYDNTDSGLTATDAQSAIDEVNAKTKKILFTLTPDTGITVDTTNTRCNIVGEIITISALFTLSEASTARSIILATLPKDYVPGYTVACYAVDNGTDTPISGMIDNTGKIKIYRSGSTGISSIRFAATYIK